MSTSTIADINLKESRSIVALNGMTFLVREWVRVLEQLTQHEGLQFLSMLTWTNIADQKGVVRSTRAWCTACYDEWQRTGQVMYEPLLWNVKAVTRCPLHQQDLLERCPQQGCHQFIPLLADSSPANQCPRCGYSLAISAPKEIVRMPFTDKQGEDIQQWMANATGDLLSAVSLLSTIPSRDRIAAGITAYISHTVSGSDEALVRKLGISKALLMGWQRGQHLPRFCTLLTMCFHMNVSPLLFLTGDVESFFLAQSTKEVNNVLKASQKSEPVNLEVLQKNLTELLRGGADSVQPLRAVARKLGYPVSTLRHYFPEQCRAITERYQQRKDADHRQALEAFLTSSEQLTLNEIARRLGCPVTTLKYRYPELCHAITRRNRRVLDIGKIHKALQDALQCEESSFPTVTEISKRFECSCSILYRHFSELCYELTKKHKDNKRRIRSSLAKTRDFSVSEVGASADRPKRGRIILGAEGVDRIGKGLEILLKNGVDRPMTMTELAARFGCARATLRRYFPDQCDKLLKKQEKKEYLNSLRQRLEAVLSGSASSMPSVNELARQLGCSSAMLRRHFPDLCKLISQRYMGLNDIDRQRNTLEEVMRRSEETNLSVNEIARRLGCANTTLYIRFPEQCKSVVKRRWQASDIDGMRQALEVVLANLEEPPPTLKDLSKLLGCSSKNLEYYFPEMCRAITERRRQLLGISRFRLVLEGMLANDDDPVSVMEAARRLGCSANSLAGYFPELCKAISARYLAQERNRSLEVVKKICDEVREIVIDLHSKGEYPSQNKVQARVSKPGHFWRLEVKETWRNTLRELGY